MLSKLLQLQLRKYKNMKRPSAKEGIENNKYFWSNNHQFVFIPLSLDNNIVFRSGYLAFSYLPI